METFSALLTLWAGNSPVTGEFPAQRPVTRSLDPFFDLRLMKWLSEQLWDWWFGTPSGSLWRHSNDAGSCYSASSRCSHPHRPQWQPIHQPECLIWGTAIHLYHPEGPCDWKRRPRPSVPVRPLCLRVHTWGIWDQQPVHKGVRDIWKSSCKDTYTFSYVVPHDDVIKWKHFPRYWPFVRAIHRSRGIPRTKASDAELSLISAWINGWVNNREAGDLRRNRTRYDVIVMWSCLAQFFYPWFNSRVNSLRPGDAYMRHQTKPSLVQIMACRQDGAKALS